jgi:uncharacterized membrane protein YdcZ (DUF606 family)
VALVPIELGWPLTGFFLLMGALLLSEISDRLGDLALRAPLLNWLAFCAPALVLAGMVFAGGTTMAADLALLLGIVMVADRWGRTGAARPWMIFTPGSALLLLILTGFVGMMTQGFRTAILLAIASLGAMLLRKPR